MRTLVGAAISAAYLSAATGAFAAEKKASKTAGVSAKGCVEIGADSCLVVKDPETKETYALVFVEGAKRPSPGMAVKVTGSLHQGPIPCTEGKALDVSRWTKARMSCKQ